jgi:hypothetical protein
MSDACGTTTICLLHCGTEAEAGEGEEKAK